MIYEITQKLGIEGYLNAAEMEKLFDLGMNKDCLEIGSYKGLSSFCLALGANSLKCVDTFADGNERSIKERFEIYSEFKQNLRRFAHVSVYMGFSEEAAKNEICKYDLIFIDAGHEYAEVKSDYTLWWPHLRVGGMMVFHDYGSDYHGVKQFVDEQFGTDITKYHTLAWVVKRK